MGQDNLYTAVDGLRSFAQTHADVATGMSDLTRSGAWAGDVAATHGPIAAGVHRALGGTLDARQGAQRSASGTGAALAESLRQVARTYGGVDQNSADQLRSAADAVEGATAPGSSGGTSGSGGAATSAFKDVSGTMTGAAKDAVGALGGILGPMTSGLGSVAGSLGSGLSSAASSLAQAAGKAAPTTAGAAPAAAPSSGPSQQADHTDQPAHPDTPDKASTVSAEARAGESVAAGETPIKSAALHHNTSQSQPR